MTREKLKRAIAEAERFLKRAKELEKRTACLCDDVLRYEASKYTSATKRASMDLTRALADLRRVN